MKMQEVSIFKCPLCHSYYWKENEAEDCLRECLDNGEHVEEETRIRYECEPCGTKFKEESSALACETRHIEAQDAIFFKWQSRLDKEKMLTVANHPSQKKLLELCQ